jgi:DNA-binding NarL/FixJ family response regulator
MGTPPSVGGRTTATIADIDPDQRTDVRVLVVDDVALFRAAMTAVVGATDGFVVVGEAASGEEAVAAAAALAPDLVLMDVNLPGIDGLEATRQVCARAGAPAVLLLSTHDADVAEEFVRRSGAAAYVTKAEFAPERLAAFWDAATR